MSNFMQIAISDLAENYPTTNRRIEEQDRTFKWFR